MKNRKERSTPWLIVGRRKKEFDTYELALRDIINS